jgi:hypothetical protein
MICSHCEIEQDESCFAFKNKTKGIRHAKCKSCQRKYTAAHYRGNKESYRESNHRKGRAVREYVQTLKSTTPCTDCKQTFHFSVMEFDHIGDDKVCTVSSLVYTRNLSWSRLKAEIAKCELVCANCHRMRSWNRKAWLRTPTGRGN